MVSSARINITTTAVALNTASNDGQLLTIKSGGGTLDLGDSSVTSGAGFSVGTSEIIEVALKPGDVLFGISDVTGTDVEVLRT